MHWNRSPKIYERPILNNTSFECTTKRRVVTRRRPRNGRHIENRGKTVNVESTSEISSSRSQQQSLESTSQRSRSRTRRQLFRIAFLTNSKSSKIRRRQVEALELLRCSSTFRSTSESVRYSISYFSIQRHRPQTRIALRLRLFIISTVLECLSTYGLRLLSSSKDVPCKLSLISR